MWANRPLGFNKPELLVLILLIRMKYWLHVIAASHVQNGVLASSTTSTRCPSENMAGCSCYAFVDGLFLECTSTSDESLKDALLRVVDYAKPSGE